MWRLKKEARVAAALVRIPNTPSVSGASASGMPGGVTP